MYNLRLRLLLTCICICTPQSWLHTCLHTCTPHTYLTYDVQYVSKGGRKEGNTLILKSSHVIQEKKNPKIRYAHEQDFYPIHLSSLDLPPFECMHTVKRKKERKKDGKIER